MIRRGPFDHSYPRLAGGGATDGPSPPLKSPMVDSPASTSAAPSGSARAGVVASSSQSVTRPCPAYPRDRRIRELLDSGARLGRTPCGAAWSSAPSAPPRPSLGRQVRLCGGHRRPDPRRRSRSAGGGGRRQARAFGRHHPARTPRPAQVQAVAARTGACCVESSPDTGGVKLVHWVSLSAKVPAERPADAEFTPAPGRCHHVGCGAPGLPKTGDLGQRTRAGWTCCSPPSTVSSARRLPWAGLSTWPR